MEQAPPPAIRTSLSGECYPSCALGLSVGFTCLFMGRRVFVSRNAEDPLAKPSDLMWECWPHFWTQALSRHDHPSSAPTGAEQSAHLKGSLAKSQDYMCNNLELLIITRNMCHETVKTAECQMKRSNPMCIQNILTSYIKLGNRKDYNSQFATYHKAWSTCGYSGFTR